MTETLFNDWDHLWLGLVGALWLIIGVTTFFSLTLIRELDQQVSDLREKVRTLQAMPAAQGQDGERVTWAAIEDMLNSQDRALEKLEARFSLMFAHIVSQMDETQIFAMLQNEEEMAAKASQIAKSP